MRAYYHFGFTNSFEYWTPQEDSGTYVKQGEDRGLIIPIASGLFAMVTREPLMIYGMVRNVVSLNGVVPFQENGSPYDMYVQSSDPQFDVYGNVYGYKHTLRRTVPQDFAQQLLDAIP